MKQIVQIATLILLMVGTVGCSEQKFIYNLGRPDASIALPSKLNEISGIELISDSVITSVQDEKAIIYYLNVETGEILDQFNFGKNGDYEGITHYKKSFFVLRSDGSIFKVNQKKKAKEYKFKHSKQFDFEGVCADVSNERLLVACKEHGDKDKRDYFFIYSFSLSSMEYLKKPIYKIKRADVHKNFMPSGIAIHPNGSIYILSSFSKTLLVISAKGVIMNNIQLNGYIFHQPEGIAFNEKGDLFISNEKKDTTATILKFSKLNEKD